MKPPSFLKRISSKQASDTGMAMALICLLLGYLTHNNDFFAIAAIALVINMIVPILFTPLATVWFGLSYLLGLIVPKIIFSMLYYGIVTPVGLVRKIAGADRLQLKKWKNDQNSAFSPRSHKFSPKDLERPF